MYSYIGNMVSVCCADYVLFSLMKSSSEIFYKKILMGKGTPFYKEEHIHEREVNNGGKRLQNITKKCRKLHGYYKKIKQ
ncbi:hypothetical protein D7X25_17960 [bacterium 1XD42-8]|nr:hypothetical protein D7X25_17960 [bacterium 1XD42-8]